MCSTIRSPRVGNKSQIGYFALSTWGSVTSDQDPETCRSGRGWVQEEVADGGELAADLGVDLFGELFDRGTGGLGVVEVDPDDDEDLVRCQPETEEFDDGVDARRPGDLGADLV